jgi:uncharacterized protein
MAQIKRYLEEKISENLKKRKILIIYGARQVGKTTLVKKFLNEFPNNVYLNGDFLDDAEKLKEPTRAMVKQFEGKSLLIIDEAQKIEDIGIKLKIIFDTLPHLQIIATGSSAFELSNVVNEPLTGRYFSFNMYPISAGEAKSAGLFEIDNFLIYGSYPEVVTTEEIPTKQKIIQNIASNYLFKDVLNIEYIKNSRSLGNLLKALALQVGSEVSLNELGNTLDLDAKTVMSYLDILEKLCIIFQLKPYFSNKRKSISKLKKYYFYDLGVRNAILDDFTPIEKRKDIGALWENFCIIERMKRNDALDRSVNYYFWRSYKGEEVDLIEVENENIKGFEFKWKEKALDKKIKEIYKQDLGGVGDLEIVCPDNFSNFGV